MMKKLVLMLSLILVMSSFAFAAGNDVNTVLLLHMDGDESSSEHVATVLSGDPTLDPGEYKFTGSMYFDGDDYLEIPDSDDWNFDGDKTIDFWVNFDNTNNQGILGQGYETTVGKAWWFEYWGELYFYIQTGSGQTQRVSLSTTGFTPTPGTWYHVAVTYDEDTDELTLYLDGAEEDSLTQSSFYTASDDPLHIGTAIDVGGPAGDPPLEGMLDELRISDTVRWSSDFSGSLPSSDYTADGDTVLLLSFDGDEAVGASADHDVTFYGDVQFDATNAPTGFEGSYKFDGTGDYLVIPDSTDFDFSDDFTVDMWVYPTTVSEDYQELLVRQGAMQIELNYNQVIVYLDNNGGGAWESTITSTGTLSANTWAHLAVVRDGNTVTIYKDGSSIGSGSFTGSIDSSNPTYVGAYPGPSDYFNGGITQLREKDDVEIPPLGGPTGPYEKEQGPQGNGVPEFSSIGMVLALLIAGLGIVFVIKKKQ
ncbi:hypothetical protein GF336_02395 [Candidatus Woesearchaeota archaeon]|nr:hypothetical protein [Candidatus Woesearchaeota archaeon]